MRTAFNGYFNEKNQYGRLCNAHISINGRSVIVDYEHCLHAYNGIQKGEVPCEMYPYNDGDIAIFHADLAEGEYKDLVDMQKLLIQVTDLLAKENSSTEDEE